jgi:hypothetical protein
MAYLGESSQLTIGTSKLKDSIELYLKLGFRIVKMGQSPYPWCKMTDDSLLIFLNQNGSHYLGYSYFMKDWGSLLDDLKSTGAEIVQNLPNEKVFFTPQDILITLVKSDTIPPQGELQNYVSLGEAAFKEKSNLPNAILGAFGELACPTKQMDIDTLFYQKLGFKEVYRSDKPYNWCILSDGLNVLGLHETTDFHENTITYFAPDVADQVHALEAVGVDSISEFTGTGGDDNNVCIKTAENQTIFFFKA